MGESLPHCLYKKILLFTALLFGMAVQGVYSQSLGDIAFIGFNGDGEDDFAIVALEEIPANTEIFFTDSDWNGSAFNSPDEAFSWTSGSSAISAGTVITFNDISTGGRRVSEGSYSGGSAISLTVSHTVIYAYTGSEGTPSAFLGSVATNTVNYDGTDGTLNGTGLSQDTTAILLSNNIDGAAYVGDRSGNTPNGYRSDLNNIVNNWEETGASGDGETFLPFDDSPFTVVPPPTIGFAASKVDSAENSGTAQLSVELVEANGKDVDVDVVYLGSSSTASSSDISGFSNQTVSFSDSDTSGTTKTVDITLDNDSDFEGTEKAVFQLQNNTAGSIIEPSELTLSISDDDSPNIVINEILYDPNADADGNGSTSTTDDEFIELVNNGITDIDISGWTLYDDPTLDLRHTFPEGTVIPASGSLVLFADNGVSPTGNLGGAIVQSSNESTTLSLNNSGDTITLKDSEGNEITSISYTGSESEESITRNPDITGSFEGHTSADAADDSSPFSPGTQVNGTPFGSKHAIAFRGTEGWRMISSPVQGTSFNDFFSDFWIQGITGSDAPNDTGTLFSWTESGGGIFSAPTNMTDNLTPGQGYIVYVFEDDEYNTPGIQGGFPKVVNSNGTENSGTVNVSVSSTDDGGDGITGNEGWNMLGNPFAADVSVTAVLDALEAVDASVNENVYVWDHEADGGNGDWMTKNDGDLIAPFQGFFVRFSSAFSSTNATFDKTLLEANTGTEFYKEVSEDAFNFELELHGEQYYDTYSLAFNDNGTVDLDRYDAYKLFSLNSNSINLYSTLSNNRIQKNVLPRDLESALEIPLLFEVGDRESLTFEWKAIENLPNGWTLTLVDKEMNREVDLTSEGKYQFTRMVSEQQKNASDETLLNKSSGNDNGDPRFVLSVKPKQQQVASDELPESAKLNPNYPNPFNPQTTIPYQLSEDAEVKLTVWNMIGQKVATLVDGFVEAGTHEESWNASNMPSGIYIARFEVAGEVFIRKMTLIK